MRLLADDGVLTFGMPADFLANDIVARHLLTQDRQLFPLFRPVAMPGIAGPQGG